MTIDMADAKDHDSAGEDLDIVVVGAGLTGLFLTHLLLEVYKIEPSKIVLLERQPKRYDLPRAAGFSDDNARLYRTCMPKEAVDSAVQKITRPVSIRQKCTCQEDTVADLSHRDLSGSGWTAMAMFCMMRSGIVVSLRPHFALKPRWLSLQIPYTVGPSGYDVRNWDTTYAEPETNN